MKKIISILLTTSIFVGCIPAFAEETDETLPSEINIPFELEEVGTDSETVSVQVNEVLSQEVETSTDNVEYEPIIHEETVNDMFEFPEEDENLMPINLPEPGEISLFSLDSTDSSMWKSMYAKMFGDDYLKPYGKKEDVQKVTGNTNRLVIEETDLTLTGKNGLDVVIKRKYDNQDYNEAYSYYRDYNTDGTNYYHDARHYRNIYGFTNKNTNERLYVAFLTDDQMYTYMYNGCYIKELNTNRQKTCTKDGKTIRYYDFENVEGYITDDSSNDWYEYDNSISKIRYTEKYEESTNNSLYSRKILNNNNYLGGDWNLILPDVYIYRYYSEITKNSSKTRTTYDEEYVGAFRDINGSVHTFDGTGKYVRYDDEDKNTYTSSFYPDNNRYLHFESIYSPKTLYTGGPEYNFVVYDSTGLTYYLYDTGMTYGERPDAKHRMYIIAVEDEYGNMIRYEYDEGYVNITKIIDTYGREINITSITGGKQISYYDDLSGETKSITYTTETKPASSLNNDSPLKPKDVRRFTVTNQEGESTIYDSREAEVINYYCPGRSGDINEVPDPSDEDVEVSSGYNIERIIYPTGSESRYRYKCLYPINYNTRVCCGVYAVDSSYDIVDGKIENKKEYSFTNSSMKITSTCLNNSDKTKTISQYNDDGMATSIKTTPQESSSPYKTVSYTYDSYNNPTSITTNENGTSSKTTYSYLSGYPNVISSVSNGLSTISYNYHDHEYTTIGSGETKTSKSDKVSKTTYTDISGSSNVVDYYVETNLTEDNKSIEYVKTVKGGAIKSQLKYEYDNEGNVTAIKQWTNDTNADGQLDENDDIITLSNSYNLSEQKTRNVLNKVSDVYNADNVNEGNVTAEYSYNIYGLPISQKDSYGTVTTVEYDDLKRPVKYNMPNGGTQNIEYNTTQKYTLVTDTAGVVTKYEVDGFGRNKAKYIKDGTAYNKVEEYSYNNAGRLHTKTSYRTNTEGIMEQYTYDALGRVTQKAVWELPARILYIEGYTYSNNSSEKVVTKTIAAGVSIATQKNHYDTNGRLTKTESVSGDTKLTTSYEYDYLSRVIKETDPNGNITTYEYNYDGQVSKQTNAAGNSVSTVYDLAGQAVSVTDANGNTTNTLYDKLGRAIKVTTPFNDTVSGETKTYYDKNSNVIKTAVKRSQNKYQIEEYKYDNMNNLIASISNDGKTDIVTQYQYDAANRITKMITGLSEYSTNPTGGAVTQYSYNNQGYLYKTIDPMGMTETYNSYDYAGNVLSVTDKNSNTLHNQYGTYGLVKSYFDNVPETKEYTYNRIGQITGTKAINVNERYVEESYSYDPFGRLICSTSNDGSVQNYTYDANSNVETYNLVKDDVVKNSIEYAYNNLNQLTTLTNNDIITSYTYDANGNLTQKALSNGVTTNYTYNNAGLMTYMESKKGSNVYTYSDCTYLLNGLLQTVEMPADAYNSTSKKLKYYNYDNMGRLTGEYAYSTGHAPILNQYWYDLRGNRSKEQVGEQPDSLNEDTVNYQYDLNNRLISESTSRYDSLSDTDQVISTQRYYYDNNGNMTAKQKTSFNGNNINNNAVLSGRSTDTGLSVYRYDAFNRLTNYNSGSSEASYTYNANNLRASKTVNREKTDFVWNGQNLAAENKGDSVNTYTYDMTGVHIANRGGNVVSYLKDYHGNIVGKTTVAGAMVEEVTNRMDYDAFGNQWVGNTPDPFGYCGEYYDSESRLIYLRNRYYDSTTGRFITEDPAKDGVNWYSYCSGNPVMLVDPSGLIDVMLRYVIEKNGGTVEWDEKTQTATVTSNGIIKIYSGKIINRRMIIDSEQLYNDFGGESEDIYEHQENDQFESIEDTAMAFSLKFNLESIDNNREYGAAIYKNAENSYSFSNVMIGNSTGVGPQVFDSERIAVAVAHTHAAYTVYDPNDIINRSYERDFFSVSDAVAATKYGVPVFVCTPGGNFMSVRPGYETNGMESISQTFLYNDEYITKYVMGEMPRQEKRNINQ